MTPSQLLLPPAKEAQLAALLASAGVVDGLQAVIDEAAQQVADYTLGYTFTSTRTDGWTRSLALQLGYTRAGVGVPEAIKVAADTALAELKEVRDGKFRGAMDAASPGRKPGALVSESSQLNASLR